MRKTKKIAGMDRSEFLKKYDAILARGLSCGLRDNNMVCIEAAVACATEGIDLDNGDEVHDQPKCVDRTIAQFKIALNDFYEWSSAKARARGLHDIGIAQLGSNTVKGIGPKFEHLMKKHLIDEFEPAMIADVLKPFKLKLPTTIEELLSDEVVDNVDVARNALSSTSLPSDGFGLEQALSNIIDATNHKNFNKVLCRIAEIGVEVLRELKSPGVEWLDALKK